MREDICGYGNLEVGNDGRDLEENSGNHSCLHLDYRIPALDDDDDVVKIIRTLL